MELKTDRDNRISLDSDEQDLANQRKCPLLTAHVFRMHLNDLWDNQMVNPILYISFWRTWPWHVHTWNLCTIRHSFTPKTVSFDQAPTCLEGSIFWQRTSWSCEKGQKSFYWNPSSWSASKFYPLYDFCWTCISQRIVQWYNHYSNRKEICRYEQQMFGSTDQNSPMSPAVSFCYYQQTFLCSCRETGFRISKSENSKKPSQTFRPTNYFDDAQTYFTVRSSRRIVKCNERLNRCCFTKATFSISRTRREFGVQRTSQQSHCNIQWCGGLYHG